MVGPYLNIPIRSDKLSQSVFVKGRLFHRQSPFQEIDIYDTAVYGKVLVLDGHIQLTDLDEHVYHEALVHVPALSLESLKRVLVIGGGDGGVIREVCKYASLERADMVEIDAAVIEACRKHLPAVSGGAFDDPRVHVHIEDAFAYIKKIEDAYDLIVVDSTDTYEDEAGALSEQLFTQEFYSDCKRVLAPGGFVVTQADNLVFCPYSMAAILRLFRSVFPQTGRYHAVVPSFGGYSGFCWASLGATVQGRWPAETASGVPLRYLNEATYHYGLAPLSF